MPTPSATRQHGDDQRLVVGGDAGVRQRRRRRSSAAARRRRPSAPSARSSSRPMSANRAAASPCARGRASRRSSSPPATATAATYVAAWMRSGTVLVVDGPQRAALDAVDRRASTCRCRRCRAPIATSNSHRSTISGSRAALSIVVTLGEHGGGQDVLGGADARELERDVGAVQAVGGRLDVAVAELERRAHRLEPGEVHVDRPGAEVVAAGHRQLHVAEAGEQRAEHVDRGADALDQLVRRDRREVAVVGEREPAACRARRSARRSRRADRP